MFALLRFVLVVLASPFRSKSRFEAENAVLRHPLTVLQRKVRGRVRLTNFVQLYRWFPSICRSSRSSVPRRSCVGIGPAFAATGVGSRAHWEGARRLRRTSVR